MEIIGRLMIMRVMIMMSLLRLGKTSNAFRDKSLGRSFDEAGEIRQTFLADLIITCTH